MNIAQIGRVNAAMASAICALLVCTNAEALAGIEEQTFRVLQIGTHSYTNVTVTTKAKDYVFLLHSTGMANIKVKDLTPELLEKFGYAVPKPKNGTNMAAALVKETLAKVDVPEINALEKRIEQQFQGKGPLAIPLKQLTSPVGLGILLGALLTLHLFFAWLFSLICQKAGQPGGFLVWLPVLQMIPLLRAAGMSGWWFLALFVPVLNLITPIIWSIKIALARGKHAIVGVFLLLPITNLFALLYLAFSNAEKKEEEKQPRRRTDLLVLEAA